MRKTFLTIFTVTILTLAVCGNNVKDAGISKAANHNNSKKVAASKKAENQTDDIPLVDEIFIRYRYDTQWHDYKELLLDFDYELLGMGKKTRDKYPELYKRLMVVNDLIATEEANSYMAEQRYLSSLTEDDIKEAVDNEHLPRKENWNIYVRRADEEVFSLVSRWNIEAVEDYNRILYEGYNFKTTTGEKILFSDVVSDMDAFCKLLVPKVADIIEPYYGAETMQNATVSKIKEYINTGDIGNWTIDPQGITVWFNSHTLIPEEIVVTVLYAEDTDGTIFNKEYSEHIPENWTMYFPKNQKITFDAEDDGEVDTLSVKEDKHFQDDYEYCTGIVTDFNGKETSFENGEEVYGFRFCLIHRFGKTILLDAYNEYDYFAINTYTLEKGRITDNGWIDGNVYSDGLEDEEEDRISPNRLITDPTNIPVSSYTEMLSTCSASRNYELTESGKLEPLDSYYSIAKDMGYIIKLKVPLKDIPIVDSKTHEKTADKISLKAGDRLTLLYTDGENYVDCMTKDRMLVRIMVYHDYDPDEWRIYVISDGEEIKIIDAFDDMKFAG